MSKEFLPRVWINSACIIDNRYKPVPDCTFADTEYLSREEYDHKLKEIYRKYEKASGEAFKINTHALILKASNEKLEAHCVKLREALVNAKLAIESLTLTQKKEGLGLLGEYIVSPRTLNIIDEALNGNV